MIVAGGRTEIRNLSIGLMNDDLAQITAGIAADDDIVAHPSTERRAGMRVATLE